MTVTPVPGKANLLLGSFDIADLGYEATEYFLSGTASSYTPDHRETAEYTTRMVVLTPTDPDRFNGTVLVEWLNVSGGIDAPALWFMAHREIVRSGYGYVAVSVQRVGVEGGESLGGIPGMSLKALDPARYASLHHPGDTFAYSIFSQAGAAIREKLGPEHVVAVGESQSAFFLTTYVNAVDPLDRVYDGFLIHSRFGPAAPLDGGSIFEAAASGTAEAVTFRDDLRVPLMTVITETDLCGGLRLGYHRARQPDTEHLRTWEIPGTAHADNYTIQVGRIDTGFAPLDDILAAYAPTDVLMGQQLPNCDQLRAAASLRPAGRPRQTGQLGSHRRTRTVRAAHRIDRRRAGDADPRRQRARAGRRAHPVGRRSRRPDLRDRVRREPAGAALRVR